MTDLSKRLTRLESKLGVGVQQIYSVRFVDKPEEAHEARELTPDESRGSNLWGSGPDTWRIYVKPGQTREDAMREVGINVDTNPVVVWN